MGDILIVSGHTDLNDSVANKAILEHLGQMLPAARFDYLDRLYPDFKIDTAAEQAKLEAADVVVLEFPVFWYSAPSILHRWMEQAFIHGWSHGSAGDKLKGKKLVVSLTTGAPEDAYRRDGATGHEIEDYLVGLKSTAALCGMEWAGCVYTGGVSYQSRAGEGGEAIRAKAAAHATRLVELLKTL